MEVSTSYVTSLSADVLSRGVEAKAKQEADNVRSARGEAIDKAARDFEAVFLSQMLGHMFESVKVNELFGGGHAEEVWRSVLVEEYGKTLSNAGGVGIAEHVKKEMIKMQEVLDNE